MKKISGIVTHWDETWADSKGRQDWLAPDERVAGIVSCLAERNVKKILDLGCGVGRHSLMFASKGFEVWALDGSSEGLDYLGHKAEKKGIELSAIAGDIHELDFSDAFFDYVLAWNVIYHGTLDELECSISEARRVLADNSIFQCTLLSANNVNFGKGIPLDRCTFIQPGKGEKSHPHCYTDKKDIAELFTGWKMIRMEELEIGNPGSIHWHIIAEKKIS